MRSRTTCGSVLGARCHLDPVCPLLTWVQRPGQRRELWRYRSVGKRIVGDRVLLGSVRLGRDDGHRASGAGRRRHRKLDRCSRRDGRRHRCGMRGGDGSLRGRVRRPRQQRRQLWDVWNGLSHGTGMPEQRVRLPCRSSHLLGRLRGHHVGREELRHLWQLVPGGHGVLAEQVRVGVCRAADGLRRFVRRYVGQLVELRQLRPRVPERPVMLDGRLPLSRRARRLRGQRSMRGCDGERPALRHVHCVRNRGFVRSRQVLLPDGPDRLQRRLRRREHRPKELRHMRYRVHDGRHAVSLWGLHQSEQRQLWERCDGRV